MSDYVRGAICFLIGLWLLVFVVYLNMKDEEAFMDECTKERPRYECIAMWRAGVVTDSAR